MKTTLFAIALLLATTAQAQQPQQAQDKSNEIAAVGERIKVPTEGFGKTFVKVITVWNEITLELDICWLMYGMNSGITCRPLNK